MAGTPFLSDAPARAYVYSQPWFFRLLPLRGLAVVVSLSLGLSMVPLRGREHAFVSGALSALECDAESLSHTG